MSEKVKLTREQAEAIENTESRYGKDLTVIRHAERYFHKEDEQVLTELTTAEVAKALYIGYEVEETFKVGDWVVDRGSVYKIISKHHADDLNKGEYPEAKHATPEEIAEEKQRRWWAKHDRDVWELREGDCLISKHDKHTCQVKFVEASDKVDVLLVDGIQDEFYEWEHDLEIMKDRYVVFCFAEDRKDVEYD